MKATPFTMLILLLGQASAMDPPVMEWEMQYYPSLASLFRDVHQTLEDGFILAGRVWVYSNDYLVRMDQGGNVQWTYGNSNWYYNMAYRVEILSDGNYISTGAFMEQSTSSVGLFISKVNAYGTVIWSKAYDYPGSIESGYGLTALPDSGFCVVGTTEQGDISQAWILRTDSDGDTLWTRTWGIDPDNAAKQVLIVDDKLVVLVHGRSGALPSIVGPHLLYYDLDGSYLYETNYPALGPYIVSDMCHASDGGITFITEGGGVSPVIVHTDAEGSLEWHYEVAAKSESQVDNFTLLGYSISPTMEGGYIFAGVWSFYFPPTLDGSEANGVNSPLSFSYESDETWGWLVRFDSEGGRLWEIKLDPGGYNEVEFYSASQLFEGGYVVTGQYNDASGGTGINGYIAQYAPETGIAEWEESTGQTLFLHSWPNPSSGPVQISLTGPERLYSLSVHDISGRLVREYPEVPLGGAAALVWDGLSDSGTPLPAGVYIAELQTISRTVSTLLMRL
jgi:hypothetical protein